MHVLFSRSMLSNLIARIRLPFRKDRELYIALRNIIGFYPHELSYYKLALMHKSIGHRGSLGKATEDLEMKKGKVSKSKFGRKDKNARGHHSNLGKKLNNERLEFLGDAILDAVVGDIVYVHFPGKPEGFLTNTRSKLVQRETLGKLAKEVGLSNLILSSGRSASHNSYMGGNAFEALVGAIYLDRGYDACMKFMKDRILGRYIDIDRVAYKEVNFKSKLIEWTQKNRIQLSFRLEGQSVDKNGSPMFRYSVVLEDVDCASATGFSKKESQQLACEQTLKMLRKDSAFLDKIFAAKTARTSMEENPVNAVPDTEQKPEDFIISNSSADNASATASHASESNVMAQEESAKAKKQAGQPIEIARQEAANRLQTIENELDKDMDLSDVSATPAELSREDIIAAAESAAYAEEENTKQ